MRSAVLWWLRYPHTGSSNPDYSVNTSGAQNNNNANNSNGFAPDCLNNMQEEPLHKESTQCGNECKETCISKMQGRILSWPRPNMQGDVWTAKDTYNVRPSALTTPNKHTPSGSGSYFLNNLTVQMLVDAAQKCANGVRWKSSVSTWMFNVWVNCAKLHRQILKGTYKLSKYVVFMIYDKKPRKIHSTKFVDRVIQRAMCDNGLLDDTRRPLIYENGACLEGKGFTFAFKLVEKYLRQFYFKNNYYSNIGWYVKIDVKKFFDNTPHSILKQIVQKNIKDYWMQIRVNEIIDSFKDPRSSEEIRKDPFGSRGVVLGSQISQLLQLLVLNRLDHTIKQKFRVKYYIRYMDDILMLVKTKVLANKLSQEIGNELRKIGLQTNNKTHIGRIQDGFTFLNVNFKLTNTGKIKKKLGKKTISRELYRIKILTKKLKARQINGNTFIQHLNSWFGSNIYKMSKGQIAMLKTSIMQKF